MLIAAATPIARILKQEGVEWVSGLPGEQRPGARGRAHDRDAG